MPQWKNHLKKYRRSSLIAIVKRAETALFAPPAGKGNSNDHTVILFYHLTD